MSNKSARSKPRSRTKLRKQPPAVRPKARPAPSPAAAEASPPEPEPAPGAAPAQQPKREPKPSSGPKSEASARPSAKEAAGASAEPWSGFWPWGLAAFALATLLAAGALSFHGAFGSRLREARRLASEGARDKAVALYRDLVEERPLDLGASFELANLLLSKHWDEGAPDELPEAWDLFERVDRFSGFHVEATLGMAEIALELGGDDLAADLLAILAERAPERPRVRLRLAQLFQREKMWPEAAYFLASLVRDPRYAPAARQELARIEREVFGEPEPVGPPLASRAK